MVTGVAVTFTDLQRENESVESMGESHTKRPNDGKYSELRNDEVRSTNTVRLNSYHRVHTSWNESESDGSTSHQYIKQYNAILSVQHERKSSTFKVMVNHFLGIFQALSHKTIVKQLFQNKHCYVIKIVPHCFMRLHIMSLPLERLEQTKTNQFAMR